MDSPILIWNAYAVSFNPNDQIRICSNPIYETALQNFERLSFYFDSFWDFTDTVRPYLSHPPPDKSFFEIGMDYSGSLRRFKSNRYCPSSGFFLARC